MEVKPAGWIEDKDIAEEFAYLSKNERSLVAGAAAQEEALAPFISKHFMSEAERVNLGVNNNPCFEDDYSIEAAGALAGVVRRYPELLNEFRHFKDGSWSGAGVGASYLLNTMGNIFNCGGLSLKSACIEDESEMVAVTLVELKERVQKIEEIAESLIESPPSEQFSNLCQARGSLRKQTQMVLKAQTTRSECKAKASDVALNSGLVVHEIWNPRRDNVSSIELAIKAVRDLLEDNDFGDLGQTGLEYRQQFDDLLRGGVVSLDEVGSLYSELVKLSYDYYSYRADLFNEAVLAVEEKRAGSFKGKSFSDFISTAQQSTSDV